MWLLNKTFRLRTHNYTEILLETYIAYNLKMFSIRNLYFGQLIAEFGERYLLMTPCSNFKSHRSQLRFSLVWWRSNTVDDICHPANSWFCTFVRNYFIPGFTEYTLTMLLIASLLRFYRGLITTLRFTNFVFERTTRLQISLQYAFNMFQRYSKNYHKLKCLVLIYWHISFHVPSFVYIFNL